MLRTKPETFIVGQVGYFGLNSPSMRLAPTSGRRLIRSGSNVASGTLIEELWPSSVSSES